MLFFEQFEQLCKQNGKKPTIILKELGLSTSKYTAWKNGSIPNLEIVFSIAKYFNVSIDYLTTGKECEPKEQPKILITYNKLNNVNKIKVDGYAEGLLSEQEQEREHINTQIS